MRLFWRDQLALIGFTALQLAAVAVVFWLDGYKDFRVAGYALLLGAAVFLAYLAYRYLTCRSFYLLLQQGQPRLEESVQGKESAALPNALGELLQAQYRHYQNQIIEGERQQRNHITFMNHWVHQMKTPLSVLELLLQDGGDPRDESMREETERIRKGLEMVLYMARLETFEQDFQVETVLLREAVNDVILDNKRLFIRSFVYPDMQIGDDLKVETDGKWLRFILQQLISNAVKYSAGSRSKVIVRAYTSDRAVILEVIDSGAGIPASDLSRIFQPFFTGENGRRFKESTGMGLYIVKSVLDKMNHEIQVESKAGYGTTARVIFPFAAR
ncbi:sensor histidine kinase [Paenibacillus harenae]|uniref:sensor histidine kinase n=1 Tax=Paenibacillus harenae TaxID=306543 RepID=UPI0004210B53|nr:sensor histidine kinase [Paenibacillus harenae]